MLRGLSRLVLYFLFLIVVFTTQSQDLKTQYRVISYDTKDGLPSNQIRDFYQDSLGYMFITTDAGLVHFNGTHFTNISSGSVSQYFRSLLKKSDGSLLVSHDAGVSEIINKGRKPKLELWLAATIQPSDTTLYYPGNLFQDSNGIIWISEPGSIVKIKDKKLTRYPLSVDNGHNTFSFAEDGFGNLWAACTNGKVYKYDQNEFEPLKQSFDSLIYIMATDQNQLLAGGNGLWSLQINSEQKLIASTRLSDIPGIRHFIRLSDNEYLLATVSKGLYKGIMVNHQFTTEKVFSHSDPHRVEELPYTSIDKLLLTEKDGIFLATDRGLGILQSNFFDNIRSVPQQLVYSLSESPEGDIYMSMGGIYRLSRVQNNLKAQQILAQDHNFVLSVVTDEERLWFGDVDGSLWYLDPGKKEKRVDLSNRGGGIFYITLDKGHNLWFCQAPTDKPIVGTAKIDPDLNLRIYSREKGLESRILVLKESANGILYAAGIGKETYLYRYLEDSDQFINLSLPLSFNVSAGFEVHDMAIDHYGQVWMATTDGLLVYDSESIIRADLGDYSEQEVRAVDVAGDGSIWLAIDTYGLIRYDKGILNLFDEQSGLVTRIINYRCLMLDYEDRIWTGTVEGLAHSQMTNIKPPVTPKPKIFKLKSANTSVTPSEGMSYDLPRKIQSSFEFACITYPGREVEYRYRLVGFDRNWAVITERPQQTIPVLAPGEYQLELQARKEGGYIWSDSYVISLVVHKPWFMTNTAYIFYILGILILVWGIVRLSVHKLRKDKQALEKLVHSQTKVINEIESDTPANQSATQEVEMAYHNLETLAIISRKIEAIDSWENLAPVIFDELNRITDITTFGIGTYIREENCIEICKIREGSSRVDSETVPISGYSSLLGWVIRHQKGLNLKSVKNEYTQYIPRNNDLEIDPDFTGSSIIYPLIHKNISTGVVFLEDWKENGLKHISPSFMQTLAAQLSFYLELEGIIKPGEL
ncbi:MAG TPA: hypothetical protein DDY13_02665 [Cytophagales bacterium]|jgi:ligand-binding sensor domain-containing protein|nr:hypothetical protein [Cytophagales bacterium]